jgi:hypothetical protein
MREARERHARALDAFSFSEYPTSLFIEYPT